MARHCGAAFLWYSARAVAWRQDVSCATAAASSLSAVSCIRRWRQTYLVLCHHARPLCLNRLRRTSVILKTMHEGLGDDLRDAITQSSGNHGEPHAALVSGVICSWIPPLRTDTTPGAMLGQFSACMRLRSESTRPKAVQAHEHGQGPPGYRGSLAPGPSLSMTGPLAAGAHPLLWWATRWKTPTTRVWHG